MKKYLFSTILVMMTLCLGFTACSDDDDNNNPSESNPLVGVWKYSFGTPTDYCLVTFRANNTGNYIEFENGKPEYEYNIDFIYSYSASNNTVKIYTANGEEVDYRIQWIDDNSFSTYFMDYNAVFTRQ